MSASQGAQRAAPRLQAADVERLYRGIGPRLHQFIRRQVGEPAIAADLLQDVFVRLLRASVELRSDGEMRSYLYRTAASLVADHYRVQRMRGTLSVPPEEAEVAAGMHAAPEQDPDTGQLRAQVEKGFARLAVRDRTLLWLACVEEMSHAEIAAVVGVGAASVKVMLFRARERLGVVLRAMGLTPEEVL